MIVVVVSGGIVAVAIMMFFPCRGSSTFVDSRRCRIDLIVGIEARLFR